VKTLRGDTAIVEPALGERVQTPRWMGGKMSLTTRLAAEERTLRSQLRDAWAQGGEAACRALLVRDWKVTRRTAATIAGFLAQQVQAAPIPVDSPVQIERISQKQSSLFLFHSVNGRAVNRSLATVLGHRLAREFGGSTSIVTNFDDHAFLLSLGARANVDETLLRAGFAPGDWEADLNEAISATETVARKFRVVAEIGQLLARRTYAGPRSPKSATWSASLLFQTLQEYEPDHPLLREAAREVLEDQLDSATAATEAARIHGAPWEVFDLDKPSPFALSLFTAFNREVLVTQDADRALTDLAEELYSQWTDQRPAAGGPR
jgi:ATP-dependent Lhr-like helicase